MFFPSLNLKSRNIDLFFISGFIGGFLFFIPIIALYLEKNLFSITNVAIIFAVEAIAIVIFEVPTGAIADLFGRKRTIMLAYIICIIGLVFLYIGGSMVVFVLFAVINALARSLMSGTDSAFIYDTLKDENKENYFKKIIGAYHALWSIGASLGSIIGGYLATVSYSFPVLVTLIPITIAFIPTLFLKEPNYEKGEHKNIHIHMFNCSKTFIRNRQLVILFIGIFIMLAFGETLHLLNSLFFEFKGISIEHFGYLSACVFGLSAIGHYLSHNLSERLGNRRTLILCAIGSPVLIFFAVNSIGFVGGLIYCLASVFFGLRRPIIEHLLNLETGSEKRATIISISNFMGYLGITIFSPFVGYLAEIYTINTAFMISAGFLLIVPVLFLFIKDKN